MDDRQERKKHQENKRWDPSVKLTFYQHCFLGFSGQIKKIKK